MDNLNFKNMQLAYQAVYDQNLCESMEELGLIGDEISEQDEFETWVNELLDEGYDLSDYTWDELGRLYEAENPYRTIRGKSINAAGQEVPWKVKATPSGTTYINGKPSREAKKRIKEDYDAFDIVLEYLLDEGYADSLESAEAIMVNMSEEWIEGILEEREPGVKPYQPRPTQAEVRADARAAARRRAAASADKTGYGPIEKFNKEEDKITRPGTEVPKSKEGRYSTPISRYSPVGAQRSRTWSAVTRATEGPGEPQAVTMPRNKPKRVIPSRLDRAPKK